MNAFEYAIVRAAHQAEVQLLRETNEPKIEQCKRTIQVFRPIVERLK